MPPTAIGSGRGGGVLVRDPRTGTVREVRDASVEGPQDEQRVQYRLRGGGGKGSGKVTEEVQGPQQQLQSIDPNIEKQKKIQKILSNPRLPLSVRQAQVRAIESTQPRQLRTFKGVPVYDRPIERVVQGLKEDSVTEKLQREISQEETNVLRGGFTLQGQVKAAGAQFVLEGVETGRAVSQIIREPIKTGKAIVENRGQIIYKLVG